MHTYNPHEGEPGDYYNPQILHHRVQHELLLQTKFKFMDKQVLSDFNSATENK
jgi:HD superfamily phosphohydrolase YqeK